MEINPLRSAKRVAEYRDKWSEDLLTDCRIKGTPSSSISVKKRRRRKKSGMIEQRNREKITIECLFVRVSVDSRVLNWCCLKHIILFA